MRTIVLVIAGTLLGVFALVFGIRATSGRVARPAAPEVSQQISSAAAQPQTSADRQINAAQEVIKRVPTISKGYNSLCAAYLQKARETGDFGFNARAEAALNKSLGVAPDNYDALKLRAVLLLTYHRFGEALDAARRAQQANPHDPDNYGALTDALVELGQYKEAVAAAQQMVDVRPGTPSYARVSYLRLLHGDVEGAIAVMRLAVDAANPQSAESVAWCRVHLGDELMTAGRREAAEKQYDLSLAAFPDYHFALAGKARARIAAGDLGSAVDLYQIAQQRVPLPEIAIALGDLYAKLGRSDDAKRQYELTEFIERTGAASGTYSRQLALFYADHDMKLDEALVIARRERTARADIYTSDALAWCLYKKGQMVEAKTAMAEALRLNTRDPRLFYHAGMIAAALGERQAAAKYLQLALQVNPAFDALQADDARRTLATIKT